MTTKWIKKANILAFPYAWQTPVKTEKWAYLQCLKTLPNNPFIQVICFPWATLVDLLRTGKHSKAKVFLDALKITPPRITLIRITICQHIYMRDLLPFFKQLNITDIFWSHVLVGESIIAGINLHPFPLYPVRYTERSTNKLKPLAERRYLYSFVGAYQAELYLTPVRQWLFNLPKINEGLIESRTTWHYDKHVYGEQISGIQMQSKQVAHYKQLSANYENILADTVFCLCPSGSGANSIRLWEALGFGCIPVILSDKLQLPGDKALWDAATLHIPESQSAIQALPTTLNNLSPNQFSIKALQTLWQRYGTEDFIYDIKQLKIRV
jgi:hypothetical protein